MEKEHLELKTRPRQELEELALIYEGKGLSKATARAVAEELTARDAFAAHLEAELHIDPSALTNPWHAAVASALSFFSGGVIPLIAISLAPAAARIAITVAAVLAALVATGVASAYAGGANKTIATVRVVVGGILAMAVTFGIGKLVGVAGI